MSIDWSSTNGTSYVTGPRRQGGSNYCWGFSTTAIVETMVRVQHGCWCARSEGDLFFGQGMYLFQGGSPSVASPFLVDKGLADPDCLPWMQSEGAYTHPASATSDRSGRTVKVGKLKVVSGLVEQKKWLDTVGPISGIMEVWTDLSAFYSNGIGIYSVTAGAANTGATHVVCIIGYDDARNCWIAKNSIGATASHPQAIFRIGYGQAAIDTFIKYGVPWVNPDPWTKRRHQAGALLVSGNGPTYSNLELFVNANGAIRHYFMDPGKPWIQVGDFGIGHPNVNGVIDSSVSVRQTTFARNFETISRFAPPGPGGALQHWVFLQELKQWHPTTPQGFGPADAVGTPGFLQSNFHSPGDFELLVRRSNGELSHLRRQHAPPWRPQTLGSWTQISQFGSDAAYGPTLLQQRSGSWPNGEGGAGVLHAVYADKARRLVHWTYEYGTNTWSMRTQFNAGASGDPHIVESMTGGTEWQTAPLDLFVPVDGGAEHFRCDDPSRTNPVWTRLSRFGSTVQAVVGVAQGHRGVWGYDIVLRTGAGLEHWVLAQRPAGWRASLLQKLP